MSPVRVLDVELAERLAPVSGGAGVGGRAYESAEVLVRLHDHPLGVVRVSLANGDVPAAALAEAVWAEFGLEVNRHLEQDGAEGLERLPLDGLRHPCRRVRPDDDGLPFVTVVVVTAQRVDRLRRCVHAILAVDYPRFEVLVVDSSPEDGCIRSAIPEFEDLRVRYLPAPAPGASCARNSGLMFARGDIVAFASDEVAVDRNWLRALVPEFLADPAMSAVMGLVLPTGLDPEPSASIDVRPWALIDRSVLAASRPSDAARRLVGSALWGQGLTVNGAVRKAALDDGWRFDPNLGPGTPCRSGEGLDASLQLLLDGRGIVWQPAALARRDDASRAPDNSDQLFSDYVGISAVVAKHALAGNSRMARAAARAAWVFAQERKARRANARPRTAAGSCVAALSVGPLAYAQARLQHAWATA